MAKIVLENLRKTYPGKSGAGVSAVSDVSLTVEDGEFMVLVGPSGCGKSTTLRMIAGLEEISSGTVSIDGRNVNHVLPKDRDVAMVFQNYALYPHMSAYENMAFGLRLRKLPRSEIDARVREAAAMLNIDHLLARRPAALSGGERQRVAVGRAIVRQPKVFLFDEPLSNLDAKMRASTRAELAKLHARLGATMIYVTHDQVEAMTLGDRICVMKDGHIMQLAAPLELYRRPANLFVAGFIGSPPMNFFSGSIERVGGQLRFSEAQLRGDGIRFMLGGALGQRMSAHAGRPMVFGIRPDGVREHATGDADPSLSVEAVVELVESMGADTYLHLKTGATSFVARVPPARPWRVDQKVRVRFATEEGSWFDPETATAINQGRLQTS